MLRKLNPFLITLLTFSLLLWQIPARSQMLGIFGDQPLAGGGTAFTGLLDLFTCSGNRCIFYGFRASSAADRGNPLMNVCLPSDTACADMSSDPVTGAIDIVPISGTSCNNTTVVCTIKIMYDRGVGGNCNSYSTVCNLEQDTIALRPTLKLACVGSLPCASCNGSQFIPNSTLSELGPPWSVMGVAQRLSGTTSSDIFSGDGENNQLRFDGANQGGVYSGGIVDGTQTDGNLHAVGASVASSGAFISIDGTVTTGTTGSNNWTTTMAICGASDGSNLLTGNWMESAFVSIYPAAISTTQMNAGLSNELGYW
jgi:hypothetical protein